MPRAGKQGRRKSIPALAALESEGKEEGEKKRERERGRGNLLSHASPWKMDKLIRLESTRVESGGKFRWRMDDSVEIR